MRKPYSQDLRDRVIDAVELRSYGDVIRNAQSLVAATPPSRRQVKANA